jgi:multiple antibiotic resistance protein
MMTKKERISLWTCKCFCNNDYLFFREYVFSLFGISMEALRIAGGIVIATSGSHCFQVNLVKTESKKKESDAQTRNDIALTPLAIPMLAGPGSILR